MNKVLVKIQVLDLEPAFIEIESCFRMLNIH